MVDVTTRRGVAIPSSGEFWGGLAAMLVALPSSIAFGVLVFSSFDPSRAGQGALFGMMGAAALGLVAPLVGRTGGLITAPCAPSAAALAGLAVALVGQGIEPGRIPSLLLLTGLLAGLLQIGYGLVGGGRFIKYIPYPVVGGYLSGVGLIIALGQLPKLFGFAGGIGLIDGLVTPGLWHWPDLTVGVVTILAMALGARLTRLVPAAVVGLVCGVVTYFALALVRPELLVLKGNSLVIGSLRANAPFFDTLGAQMRGLLRLRLADVGLVASTALTLSALVSIDTLKTCVVLDAVTQRRHDSNRELRGQGIANLAAFAAGGMAGAGTMGPTMVNVTSGGSGRASSLFEGLFVVLVIVALEPLIAWMPISALAGMLLVVAFRMIDWNAFRLLCRRDTMLDFAVMATVVVTAETVGLIEASAAGIGLAIILFIRDQIRSSVLRRRDTLAEVPSKAHRLERQRSVLRSHGDQAAVIALQGNLFFGTTDQLFTELEADLKTRRFLLLDMRRVQSMDYTAANLFRQIHRRLADRGGGLLLCGLPSALAGRQDIRRYLEQTGLTGEEVGIRVFDIRDEALEWMEDRILQAADCAMDHAPVMLDLAEIEMLQGLDGGTIDRLRSVVREVAVPAGEPVCRQGESGDEIFMVRSGEVRILLPLPGGNHHHLASFRHGDFFGDIAFLDRGTRSADVVAKSDCELYALSRDAFDRKAASDPTLAARVFDQLAHALSLRLRAVNAELGALEDR